MLLGPGVVVDSLGSLTPNFSNLGFLRYLSFRDVVSVISLFAVEKGDNIISNCWSCCRS